MIMTSLQMLNKPFFVRYGESIPLDKFESSDRVSTRLISISKSLTRWRKTIESFNSQAQIQHGQGILLMYFCSLSRNTNHFTLLEINEQEKRIYHYDSMANQDIINGKIKQTQMGNIVQVSLESYQDIDRSDMTFRKSLAT